MEPVPKSPQELAAQIMDAYPSYDELYMPEDHAAQLKAQAQQMRQELLDANPYMLSDHDLTVRLTSIQRRAAGTGVWQAHKGDGADERLEYAKDKLRGYGFPEEEVVAEGISILKRSGFSDAMRYNRKTHERNFSEPISTFIESRQLEAAQEEKIIAELTDLTIDIATVTVAERQKLATQFSSGNFLYHGAGTEQLIAILESGSLVNYKALHSREKVSAEAEGREEGIVHNNSGYEGISWSMNGIDALPGDRYHMAGFVASPEKILGADEQLAVPSRPAPDEVLQLSSQINANQFYDAKTQVELYRTPGTFGEANAVVGNILSLITWDKDVAHLTDEPLLRTAKREGILRQPDYQVVLREHYEIQPDGTIRLSPDLLQQVHNEIPVAAVWLQAAIDADRFKGTTFTDKSVTEIIDMISEDNFKELLSLADQDWTASERILDDAENKAADVRVPIEEMYFVAPRKDADKWLKVIARIGHKPAGVLLYDDKKIRLENFASKHRGDHQELTNELQSVIMPGEGYIDYSAVIGTELTDDMRTGSMHQVVAEKYLAKRAVIKIVDGKLKIER